MSKIINDKDYRPGSIYRIALENFVTYKQVELYPGPSLNLIIGPNGTGKSTFVCAIILGLCGKPSVIGRAKKISEYVRSGCQDSKIVIELYQAAGKRNVIIQRDFNLNDVSKWSIDMKQVPEKKVQELIASFNIQVDNLCQLLPQDRVQDFSKMNPQELLRSTLLAVGGQDRVAQLDELIEWRNDQKRLSTQLNNNAQVLQEKIRLNERLKVQIDAMKERQEMEEEIDICNKKKLWLDYRDLREKVIEYTTDKKNAQKIVNTHRTKIDPLESVINTAKVGISKLEQQKLRANRDIESWKEKVKELINSVRAQEFIIKDLDAALADKLERHRHREREIVESKAKLDKLITDRARLMEEVGDADHVKMQLAELQKPMRTISAAIDDIKKQKLQIQYDVENNITPQIRLYQHKIQALQNVDSKRLEVLSSYSEHAYRATLWLRDNRDLFQQEVYEPMMLEINFTDPKYARYLESTVSDRDLVAFTFESSQDMNLFLKKVRGELGLSRVNAVCSEGGPFTVPDRSAKLASLRHLGFLTYLASTVSAPAPIVRYLCGQYLLHDIPVGNDHTYNNSGKVPADITLFFTENHRFSVRQSRYSGAKSSSTVELRAPKLLAHSVDTEQLEGYNRQLSNFEQKAIALESKVREMNQKLEKHESKMNELNVRRKKINEGDEKLKAISVQIRVQTRKVQEIETETTFDVERERATCRKKQRDAVKKQCTMHRELYDVMKRLHGETSNGSVWTVKLEFSRNAIVQQESELRELKSELRNVQATLENIENQLTRSKSTAKEKLLEAKRSCNNMMPEEPGFPHAEAFARLPSDATALRAHAASLAARRDCLDQTDESVIKEYEERERLIARLRTDVSSSSDRNKELSDKMNRLREQWLPPLESLLQEINSVFGSMFAQLNCAGEVGLEKAGEDTDFDQYGVSLLVRFRDGEQLRQLTRHAQSGGERALATALYLLSLQRRAKVPFRCVDEINQGMDPINERRMFQLLVKVTTASDNGQYFLLTPKLLTNLEYNPQIMVHTIMNGRAIVDYSKWKYQKFIEYAHLLA